MQVHMTVERKPSTRTVVGRNQTALELGTAEVPQKHIHIPATTMASTVAAT